MPSRRPPAYDGPRPAIARGGYVSITRSIRIDATPEQVRAFNDDPDRRLEDVVKFDTNFPAVADTEPLVGDWVPGTRAGNRRRVRFTDGNYLAEEVVDDTPDRFRYMIWGFTNAQRFAIRHGLAEFRYGAREQGTQLDWTYAFLPKSVVFRPFIRRFLRTVMTPMMTATLAAMRHGAEAAVG